MRSAASVTTIIGCMNVDPSFINVVPANYHNPTTFNFGIRPGAPVIGAGTSVGAPSYDIVGAPRPRPPSIGAYEAEDSQF